VENGVFYRAGWSYYPFYDPLEPGEVGWSPRVGIDTYYYAGNTPSCAHHRDIGTDWGLPPEARQVRFIYELAVADRAFPKSRTRTSPTGPR